MREPQPRIAETPRTVGQDSADVRPAVPTAGSLEGRIDAWTRRCDGFQATEPARFTAWRTDLRVRATSWSLAGSGGLTHTEIGHLLLDGRTPAGREPQDCDEVRGHDRAFDTVLGWVHERRLPTPADLCDLHRQLWGRTDPHLHLNANRQSSYWLHPGEYKRTANSAWWPGHGRMTFAPPDEVPDRVATFCRKFDDYSQSLRTSHPLPIHLNIVPVLADLHRDLILIHPFDDGNGRIARLVVNHMAMLHAGVPALIDPSARDAYAAAGAQACHGKGLHVQPLRDCFARALDNELDFALAVADGRAAPDWRSWRSAHAARQPLGQPQE